MAATSLRSLLAVLFVALLSLAASVAGQKVSGKALPPVGSNRYIAVGVGGLKKIANAMKSRPRFRGRGRN